MTINDLIATQTMNAYNAGVLEGRKQLREELELEMKKELKDLERYGRTGLWGIHKALYLIHKKEGKREQ